MNHTRGCGRYRRALRKLDPRLRSPQCDQPSARGARRFTPDCGGAEEAPEMIRNEINTEAVKETASKSGSEVK